MPGDDQALADRQNRRAVHHHVVVLGPEFVERLFQRAVSDESMRAGLDLARRQHVNLIAEICLNRIVEIAITRQNIHQTRSKGQFKQPMDVGRAHVAIDQQSSLPRRRGRGSPRAALPHSSCPRH